MTTTTNPTDYRKKQYLAFIDLYDLRVGQITLADLRELWGVNYTRSILESFEKFGWEVPEVGRGPALVKNEVVGNPPPQGREFHPDACRKLAMALAEKAVEDVRAGVDVESNLAFLKEGLGAMALELAGVEPALALRTIVSGSG